MLGANSNDSITLLRPNSNHSVISLSIGVRMARSRIQLDFMRLTPYPVSSCQERDSKEEEMPFISKALVTIPAW